MRFDILTIFPNIFDSYFNESILKRAQKSGKIKIKIWNLRDFTKDKSRSHGDRGSSTKWSGHNKVDDRPYGGGPGMVMKIEPLVRTLEKLKIKKNTPIILFSAFGKQFDAKLSRNFAKNQNRIIMICGHYEGVDERIKTVLRTMGYGLMTISVGPYVLTGGELPAMVVLDSVSRQIPGVLGKFESLEESRHGVGVPVYTRPEIFKYKNKKYIVPKVLLSGNHKKIDEWRQARRASP